MRGIINDIVNHLLVLVKRFYKWFVSKVYNRITTNIKVCQDVYKIGTHKEHIYIFISLLLAYIWQGFGSVFEIFFDNNILPYLEQFHSTIWSVLSLLLLVVWWVIDLVKKYKNRYLFLQSYVFVLIWVVLIGCVYRFSDIYIYEPIVGFVSYCDIFLIMLAGYLFLAIRNFMVVSRFEYALRIRKYDESAIISDWPIFYGAQDLLDLEDDAKEIANQIIGLDRKRTWSIAITAPWGTGKTSFLNMIEENLDAQRFEVINFTPRDCKSYQNIQEEFLSLLLNAMSKYDARCSGLIKDYMASLLLIDRRGVVDKLFNIYHIWDKMGTKEKLKSVFANLNKLVVVIIDDFDRLERREIIEVLKLIDSNAAFPNMLFLTAFDKQQVSKIMGDSNTTYQASFTDKFFNMEIPIPSRSYAYLQIYLQNQIISNISANESEKKSIQESIKNRVNIMQEYLSTMRDIKRFVNQFVLDYKMVRGDVILDDFLLIHLIKYKYPEELAYLYKLCYLESWVLWGYNHTYFLNDNANKAKSYSILKILFPQGKEERENTYLHVCEKRSFSNYFVNRVYTALRIAEIEQLFQMSENDARNQVKEWSTTENQCGDIITYLENKERNCEHQQQYLRYAKIVAWTAMFKPDSHAFWLLLRMFYTTRLIENSSSFGFDKDKFVVELLNTISDASTEPKLKLLCSILHHFTARNNNVDDFTLDLNEIRTRVCRYFLQVVIKSEDGLLIKDFFHYCMDDIDPITKKITLNKDACLAYHKYIEKHPEYYIKNFVYLGGYSSNSEFNSIVCEPFCTQIFGANENIENFIDKCYNAHLQKSKLAKNFWILYKANNYEALEFHNQGDVKQKIDDDLQFEVDEYNKLCDIQHNLQTITCEVMDVEERKRQVAALKTAMEKNALFVELRATILSEMNDVLEETVIG